MENQIKKDLKNLKEKIDELLDDRKIVYNEIAKLYDYIDENRDLIEIEYVFEKLADIQNYCN